jgi:hypothetical protein
MRVDDMLLTPLLGFGGPLQDASISGRRASLSQLQDSSEGRGTASKECSSHARSRRRSIGRSSCSCGGERSASEDRMRLRIVDLINVMSIRSLWYHLWKSQQCISSCFMLAHLKPLPHPKRHAMPCQLNAFFFKAYSHVNLHCPPSPHLHLQQHPTHLSAAELPAQP